MNHIEHISKYCNDDEILSLTVEFNLVRLLIFAVIPSILFCEINVDFIVNAIITKVIKTLNSYTY